VSSNKTQTQAIDEIVVLARHAASPDLTMEVILAARDVPVLISINQHVSNGCARYRPAANARRINSDMLREPVLAIRLAR
jgi:hypothetical protein